jgi:3-oxoacyl-[acyl-carrier-protein] synthase-1
MESVAFNRVGLQSVPVNSIKGFIGHTLGAAGIIESVIGARCLKQNMVIKTIGLQNPGLAQPINTIQESLNITLQNFVKTASGFGGSNAVAFFKKHE